MPISRESELEDIIENMEDGIEDLRYLNKLKIKELIEEFLTDLDSYFSYLPVIFEPLRNIKNKWEKRLKQ